MYRVEAFFSSFIKTTSLGRVVGTSVISCVLLLSSGCFEEAAKEASEGLTKSSQNIKEGLTISSKNLKEGMENLDPLNIKGYANRVVENERLKSQKKSLTIRVTHVTEGSKVNVTGRVQDSIFWENVEFPRSSSPELTLLLEDKPQQPEPPILETVPEAVSAPGAATVVADIPMGPVNPGRVLENMEEKQNDVRRAIIERNTAKLAAYNQAAEEFPAKQIEWQEKWFDAIFKSSQVNVMSYVNSNGELPIILDIEPKTESWFVRIELVMEPWTSPTDTIFVGNYSSDNQEYQQVLADSKNKGLKDVPTITQHINTRIVSSIAKAGGQPTSSN